MPYKSGGSPVFADPRSACVRMLSQRCPGAVRIAAGGPARDLRASVDIDGMGVVAALGAAPVVGRARNDVTAASRIGILPGDRRAGAAGFERVHLRRVGAGLVLVVHRSADTVAQEAANRGTRDAGRDPLAGSAAELRPDR